MPNFQKLQLFLLSLVAIFSTSLEASEFTGLNYQVFRQINEQNAGPGIYLKPIPKVVVYPKENSVVPVLQYPIERVLKARLAGALYEACYLDEYDKGEDGVTDDKLKLQYQRVLSVNGDWNGDGLRDLFFAVKVHYAFPDTGDRWCGFQLENIDGSTKPEVITFADNTVWDDQNPYGLATASGYEARDLDGDGKDELIVKQPDGSAAAFYSNGAGELFGLTSWSASYVAPTELENYEVPESDVLPKNGVGATGGAHSVGVDGAASYSIPINAPAGAGGQNPGLSISYSSNGGNGSLGFGWQLGGQSRIHRCGKTRQQDDKNTGVTFTSEDQLCLDGQRLVLVAGSHWGNGSEYRTENESFARIFGVGSVGGASTGGAVPASFKVLNPDGSVSRYEKRIYANGNTDGSPVMEWVITEVSDKFGNYREYQYGQNENEKAEGQYGSYRLESVRYGGNKNISGSVHTHEVTLGYATRSNGYYGFMSGALVTNPDILTTISVFENGHRLRFYTLKYQHASHNNALYLKSVTECAASHSCLKPTDITWSEYASGFDIPQKWLSTDDTGGKSLSSDSHDPIPNQIPEHEFFLDLNGDAKADRIWSPANGVYEEAHNIFVAISDGTEFDFTPGAWLSRKDTNNDGNINQNDLGILSKRGARETFSDMNGDGLPDYVWQPGTNTNRIYVALNQNGQGFGDPQLALEGDGTGVKLFFSEQIEDVNFDETTNGRFEAFVDLTGDGKVDKIWRPKNKADSGSDVYYIAKSSGGSDFHFQMPVVGYKQPGSVSTNSFKGARETYVDVTGDGYPDRVWFPKVGDEFNGTAASGFSLYVAVNKADGTGTFYDGAVWLNKSSAGGISTISGYANSTDGARKEGYADFNGDGAVDRWWIIGMDSIQQMYVALSNGRDAFLAPTVWLKEHGVGGIEINSKNSKSRYFMDVNDDGYLDYVWRPEDQSGKVYVALSTGRGFMEPQPWLEGGNSPYILSSSSNTHESFADVDGDGVPDRVWIPNDGETVWVDGMAYKLGGGNMVVARNKARRSSEVVKIRNGFGHETNFEYAPLTDATVYSKSYSEDTISNPHKPLMVDARRVVKSVETSNGIGGYQKTGYKYFGLRIDTIKQESLGFAKIVVTNQSSGLFDTTFYNQDNNAHKQGLIDKTKTEYVNLAGVPVVLSETNNTWEVQLLSGNVNTLNKRYLRKLNETLVSSLKCNKTYNP